jgi:EmrB/QacA subfamily drug resistance transporter
MSEVVAENAPTSTPAPGDRAPTMSRSRINIIFVTVLLGILLAALDQTVVSTALPTIVADLGGATHLAWVVTAYLLAQTVSVALAGKFGDLFGRKRVFQISAAIFVVGSMLCGLAQNLLFLVVFRAVQGIGGGGLMVTATALIGDVIPLRDRGRYQGALGAVFGVTTVVGPLLGGLFTDHLSWRWAFYINVPLAAVVIVAAGFTIPQVARAGRPVIDYPGIVALATGTVGLTLAATWGGTTYPWASPEILGLLVGSVVVLVGFVLVERRSREPTLPLRLFTNPVFAVCAPLSFIVGFAMLGSLTFLPTYLQYVIGVSATASGIRMLPMVAGLLVASTLAGSVVGRTGRYKIFPVAGTAVMAVGLLLLSTMDQNTSVWLQSLFLVVLGVGIGLAMQVLTLVVQNTVPYRDLGVATSGVTFFRTIGSSFGAAIFGAIYAAQLAPNLGGALASLPGVSTAAASSPEALARLAEPARSVVAGAYAETVDTMFLWAAPVALVGLVLALLLKQVPMRGGAQDNAVDVGDGFAMAVPADPAESLGRVVSRLLRTHGRAAAPGVLADAGLDPETAWCLASTGARSSTHHRAELSAIAAAHRLPPAVLRPAFGLMAARGLLQVHGDVLTLTDTGRDALDALVRAWRRWLAAQLVGWGPVHDAELEATLRTWAIQAVEEDETPAPVGSAAVRA